MTPEEVGARLVRLLGGDDDAAPVASVSGGGKWARATVDVPACPLAGRPARGPRRRRTGIATSSTGCPPWTSWTRASGGGAPLVDHPPARGVLVRRLRPAHGAGRRRRSSTCSPARPGTSGRPTRCSASTSPGHPGLAPLLLPPEFEGHPAAQGVRARLPGREALAGREGAGREPDATAARRQPMRPPGVPDPGEWGPQAGKLPPAAPARPRRTPPGERPPRKSASPTADQDGEAG